MRTIKTDLLTQDFANHSALFFTPDGILVQGETSSPVLPFSETVQTLEFAPQAVFLDGDILVVQCESSFTSEQLLKKGFYVHNTKTLLPTISPRIQQLILRAVHWLTWDTTLQYCSKCGEKAHKVTDLPEKKCAACEHPFYPSLSPAVMVLIQRENEILLARSPHYKPGIYATIAGFIDLGETAEAAVHREVKEEVGLEISNLEYFGTQSWPFPASFMIAFKAQYLRGDIKVDTNELEDARWFSLNNLPELPSYASIARKLIESAVSNT